MERGVYFDAWFPLQHNYHPSFPARRLRMIDHLEDYRATMLVWAALGGGNLALPYLEEEAFGSVPARYRVYGFLNDSEFIAECGRRGIKVFGVVFEHAWEYPAELNDDETASRLSPRCGAISGELVSVLSGERDHFAHRGLLSDQSAHTVQRAADDRERAGCSAESEIAKRQVRSEARSTPRAGGR